MLSSLVLEHIIQAMGSTSQITGTSVGELAASFTRSLRAENKSNRTVET
jgi:hypothetical protein